MVIFFLLFEMKLFCFVVAMNDLVHDVEAIHGLFKLLKGSENLF